MAREELVKVPAVILGGRLRGKRKGLKMSQHQLGGEDFSPSYVSAVERGKIRPSLKALYILADRLGEPVTYFLADEGATRSTDMIEDAVLAAAIDVLQGRPADAIATLKPLATAEHAPHVRARVRLGLGQAYLANRQPADALPELQEACHLGESSGDVLLAVHACLEQGNVYLLQHKPSLAVDVHRRCLHLMAQAGCKDVRLWLQIYAGLCQGLLALDRVDEALACHNEAAQLAGDVVDLRSLASALWATSVDCAQAHDTLRARQYAEKSMCAFEALRTLSASANLRAVQAMALAASGETAAAERAFRAAKELSERIGDQSISAATNIKMGQLASLQSDFSRAESLITAGVALANASGDDAVASEGLLALAQTLQAQGRRTEAEAQFQAAIARMETAGFNGALSNAYFRYGQALVAWGETALGSEYLEKAYLRSRQP